MSIIQYITSDKFILFTVVQKNAGNFPVFKMSGSIAILDQKYRDMKYSNMFLYFRVGNYVNLIRFLDK